MNQKALDSMNASQAKSTAVCCNCNQSSHLPRQDARWSETQASARQEEKEQQQQKAQESVLHLQEPAVAAEDLVSVKLGHLQEAVRGEHDGVVWQVGVADAEILRSKPEPQRP